MKLNRDNILASVSNFMNEQAEAYSVLDSATRKLSNALVQSDLPLIDKYTREGESELTRMRSRMLEIMSALTQFAEQRAADAQKLDPQIKEQFEQCAKQLIEKARDFKSLADKTANLALAGSSFASACIQVCGVPPTTYNKPVLNRSGGNS